jgi:hypothetical protein
MLSIKAQTLELIEILVLVIFSSLLIIFFYTLSTKRVSELTELSVERNQEMKNSLLLVQLFYSEITGTNRTLAQLVGDAISCRREMVKYGKGLGVLNVTEVLQYFLDNYFENWQLDLKFKKIGREIESKKRIYTAEILVPLSDPAGNFERIYLYWWYK